MDNRASGILLHITSLPSAYGIGDLGPEAYKFADFLSSTDQKYWQILPLNPTELGACNSPYSSFSAFAGNPLLISPEALVKDCLLNLHDLKNAPSFESHRVDYEKVAVHRRDIFEKAFYNFERSSKFKKQYEKFCEENSSWLDDFALFVSLRERFELSDWSQWPPELRDRQETALKRAKKEFFKRMKKEKFLQYIFFKQWRSLKEYCNKKYIEFIGDLPIYVDYHSADVWSHQGLFKLNVNRRPEFVGGVPPDYFSETGQRWGSPVYQWDQMKKNNYAWWLARIGHNLKLYDSIRIDHFRGLVSYWEIPANEKTAINGKWKRVPVHDFLGCVLKKFPGISIIAEDLGIITPYVKKVMKDFDFPGMQVMMFAFGEDSSDHPYLPHNYIEKCIAFTGTHDNNTVLGWYENDASPEEKQRVARYLEKEIVPSELPWDFVRLIMESKAETVIFPIQDILRLGKEARMNQPSTTQGNWEWRLDPVLLTDEVRKKLSELTKNANRI